MSDKYTLFKLSCPWVDIPVKPFDSEEAAWKWVEDNFLCKTCKEDVKRGVELLGDDEDFDPREIENASATACGAEWMVETVSNIEK